MLRALPNLESTVRRLKPVEPDIPRPTPPTRWRWSPRGRARCTRPSTTSPPIRPARCRRIADLSRMGDFEALKVVRNLVANGNLQLVAPPRGGRAAMKELAAGGKAFARSGIFFRLVLGVGCFVGTLAAMRSLAATPAGHVEGTLRHSAGAHLVARRSCSAWRARSRSTGSSTASTRRRCTRWSIAAAGRSQSLLSLRARLSVSKDRGRVCLAAPARLIRVRALASRRAHLSRLEQGIQWPSLPRDWSCRTMKKCGRSPAAAGNTSN